MKFLPALLLLASSARVFAAPANQTLDLKIWSTTAPAGWRGQLFTVAGNNGKVLGISGGQWALVAGGGGGGSSEWGGITGTITDQADLVTAFGQKQGLDPDLTIYAGITPSANVQSLLGAANYGAARTLLSLVPGTDVQAYDADLAAISAVATDTFGRNWLNLSDEGVAKERLALDSVENTALSTWGGTTNLTTLGTIGSGTWQASTLGVPWGGTGRVTSSAYRIIAGGTTSTAAQQSVEFGTAGEFLMSNGNTALATFEPINGLLYLKTAAGGTTPYSPSADTDAARGTALITAVAAMAAGDELRLGPGTYDIGTTQLVLPANSAMLGAGERNTIIDGDKRSNNIKVASGVRIADLKVICITPSNSTGHSIIGNESAGFTNVIIDRCWLVGEQDVVNGFGGPGVQTMTVRDSRVETEFDTKNSSGAASGTTSYWINCHIIADGSGNPDPSAGLGGISCASGEIVYLDGCWFEMGDAAASPGTGGAGIIVSTGGTVHVRNTNVSRIVGSGAGTDLYQAGGTMNVTGGKGSGTGGVWTTTGTITYLQGGASANVVEAPIFAADAGSNDTYVATLAPPISAYVTGAHYRFKANTANTGAATLNLNGIGAKTIVKVVGGITTALADNDIRSGQWVDVVYDGTNLQMQSLLGNAAAGSGDTVLAANQTFTGTNTFNLAPVIAQTNLSGGTTLAVNVEYYDTLSADRTMSALPAGVDGNRISISFEVTGATRSLNFHTNSTVYREGTSGALAAALNLPVGRRTVNLKKTGSVWTLLDGAVDAETANLIYAGPASGGAAAPTFRAMVTADVPATLDAKNLTTSTATTPSTGDDDTSLATTAYVQDEVDTTQTGVHATPSTTNPLAPTWTGPTHVVWYGATGEIDLPAASGYAGRGLIVYNTGAFTVTFDPSGSEVIVRDGTVQTGGVSFTLSSGAGNYVALLSDGARWITLGYKGTLTVGS